MPTPAQLQKIWLLSDTVLYAEAVAFMRQFVQKHPPLPANQINGLLNIAESGNYDALRGFVVHQRDRNWLQSKRFIKDFYTALEQKLSLMQRVRLQAEFHLLSTSDPPQESKALMALLAREFIQHLVAENGMLAAK